jgi:hypothetical protein
MFSVLDKGVTIVLPNITQWQVSGPVRHHHLQDENVERMFFLMTNSSALEGLIDCDTTKQGNQFLDLV